MNTLECKSDNPFCPHRSNIQSLNISCYLQNLLHNNYFKKLKKTSTVQFFRVQYYCILYAIAQWCEYVNISFGSGSAIQTYGCGSERPNNYGSVSYLDILVTNKKNML